MDCKKVALSAKELLDPDAPAWEQAKPEKVHLDPTPVNTIPSKYIDETVDPKEIGKIRNVEARSLHNGKEIFVRLEWADETQNDGVNDSSWFADGIAMLFPMSEQAPLATMGSTTEPVNAWHWRADFENKPKNVVAAGLGTVQRSEKSPLMAASSWKEGKWQVVLGRALEIPALAKETIQLKPGGRFKVGIAAWDGGSGERGGVKAYTTDWRNLVLEA
ncbi:MAG: hypothetical protein HYY20_11080 [Candidatus Tectomicrobia bacterium]|uniref:Cytochrome c-552/DMSO reductase-like haem-binding domain-containing protein n=1 Tax=Tectimicrobiota bacterium TaxID=2528274 RepID=A0A932CQG0_UNCTE|nr:hypothetical protein [Candidatus Tectomicrobia bacterium]